LKGWVRLVILFLLALAYLAPEQGMEISACLCYITTTITKLFSVYISHPISILRELIKGCFPSLLASYRLSCYPSPNLVPQEKQTQPLESTQPAAQPSLGSHDNLLVSVRLEVLPFLLISLPPHFFPFRTSRIDETNYLSSNIDACQ
jgi:hypothetical protein